MNKRKNEQFNHTYNNKIRQKYIYKYVRNMIGPRKKIIPQKIRMSELKENGCAICGYNKCERSLHFHHVNPEDKKFQIGQRAMKYSERRLVEELNKCILLCCNCHGEYTRE